MQSSRKNDKKYDLVNVCDTMFFTKSAKIKEKHPVLSVSYYRKSGGATAISIK
jgi:hypothetical protein